MTELERRLRDYEDIIHSWIAAGRIPESWIKTWPDKYPPDALDWLPKNLKAQGS